jgi:hypothetical protein
MNRPPYTRILSRDERAAAVRTGMLLKAASHGGRPADLDHLLKQGDDNFLESGFDIGTKAIIYGSLLTGIPIGIMAHMIHSKTKQVRGKEREMQSRIDFYNQAAQDIETGLAQTRVR